MKKIIRLTESDLTRIVRRVIKEQESGIASGAIKPLGGGYTENAKKAIKFIEDGMGSTFGGYQNIQKGVYAIKTKEDYQNVLKHCMAKNKGYKTILNWINTEWKYTPSSSDFKFGLGNTEQLNNMIVDIERHLKQFNPSESTSKFTTMGKSPGRTSNDGTFKPRN